MAKLHASGNLVNVNQTIDISCIGKFTGAVGILFYGDFGANGVVRARLGGLGSSHATWLLNPATGGKTQVIFDDVGLYYMEGHFSGLRMQLSNGEDGVTDINYKIYLKPRP